MARHERLDVNKLHVKTINVDNFDGTGATELSGTEVVYLDGLTTGTVTASKAVVVDANKDIGDFRNLDAVNIDAGASGTAGTVDVFPGTASKGKIAITAADNTNDDTITIVNAEHGQATTITIPDGGNATTNIVQSTAALTLAEADVLDGATAGTAVASKAVVVDGSKDIVGLNDVGLRYLTSTGNVGSAGTGCTAQEFGNGYIFNTRITISQTDAFTVADAAALADGHAIYTFPAGQILLLGAAITDCAVTLAEDSANAVAEAGLGTLVGSGANATLGAVGAGAENISGPITTAPMDGTAMSNVAGLAAPLAIADGDSHVVYFNIASTWNDTAGVDLTGDLTGVVHLVWCYLGNPA